MMGGKRKSDSLEPEFQRTCRKIGFKESQKMTMFLTLTLHDISLHGKRSGLSFLVTTTWTVVEQFNCDSHCFLRSH